MPLIFLSWLLLAGVILQCLRLALIWRRGVQVPVNWIAGLLALPRRYLVDVHAVVARRPAAARMHQVVAGGLLGGVGLLLLGVVPGLRHARFYWVLVAVAFGFALVGAGLVRRRRVPVRPVGLSGGAFGWLPVWLGGFAAGGLMGALGVVVGSPVVELVGVVLAAVGGGALVSQVGRGPMRHAVAGALHLVAHPRPERFAGAPAAGLRAVSLDAPQIGVGAIGDFAWNRLLGFDACVQCGRCEEACPAFAAGQPLNPKALIQDFCVVLHPATVYAGSPHPGAGGLGSILGRIGGDTLWSCTTCRACVASCPMMIEHVDAVIDLRRYQTLELGAAPGRADAVLAELRYAGNAGGFAPARRLDSVAGLGVRVLAPGDGADILLWLGDGAFDLRYGESLRALVAIMRSAKLDFAILGADEQDCGDVARRLGDEVGFARLARLNIATLATRRFGRIVTADPHALHVLLQEYPAFGGHYVVQHHTALIDALLESGVIGLGRPSDVAMTYHDPCYLGRYNGEIAAPRRILGRLTVAPVEMARSGVNSFCCGGGGGAPVADIAGERRIPDMRMAQARETGAAIVAVACPGCTAMMEGVVEPRLAVRDIAEMVRDAMVAA